MQLEDYFNFVAPDDIRIKGHRIGIESILYEYVHRGRTAEEIVDRFPTLTLEQIQATISYYLQNKPAVGKYLADWIEDARVSRARQNATTSSFLERVRKLKSERMARGRSEA